jgi:hypothetical protein
MPDPHGRRMKMLAKPVLCVCLAATMPLGVAVAHPAPPAQDAEPAKRKAKGQHLPVREIERRVIPRMPGAQYLGFDFDPETEIYTLKFLRNGSVIWVFVDGRTGSIVRRTGN